MKSFHSQVPVALCSSDGHFNEILSATGEKNSKYISGEIVASSAKGFRCLFVLQMLPWQIKCNIYIFANTVQLNTENRCGLTGISGEILGKSKNLCLRVTVKNQAPFSTHDR